MTTIYVLIVVLALYAFCSSKINTDAIFKKLWLLFVILGAAIDFSQSGRVIEIPNYFIEFGILIYLASEAFRAVANKRNRRADDRARKDSGVKAR